MRWILDQMFAGRLERQTEQYLRELRRSSTNASSRLASELIKKLGHESGPRALLGESRQEGKVFLPVSDILNSHAMVTGGTGCGKTRFALLLVKSLIALLPKEHRVGFCVVDPKTEVFTGALFLLKQRLAELGPAEAAELRRRIVIIDFSLANPLSSYNILARWPNADADFFAGSRADLLLDLLPGGDALSLSGGALLRKAILLLSEFGLPIGWLDDLLFDDALRGRLLTRSSDRDLIAYFARQFPTVPKQTVAALSRRMDALFSSDALRCALSGQTAPDFRALQDEGKIVLINCAGPNLSRGVRHLLQALVVTDFCQAVFSRQRTDSPFILFADEGQNFFITERLRDLMSDFLCLSRSFGVHGVFLTQSIATAIQDARVISALNTNLRWSMAMRGTPSDAAYLKGALPVTGRKAKPRISPFDETSFYTLTEERSLALDGIANLPDREGFFWPKSRSREALLIRTADLDLPRANQIDREIAELRTDPTFGMRQSRNDYERVTEQRAREWRSETSGDVSTSFAEAYRRTRGEDL